MKFGASLRNRQVIARLDKGEDFIESLKAFFMRERARSCVFMGSGFFSKCRLQTLDPDQHAMTTIFSSDSFVSVPNIIGNITMMGNETIVSASCVVVYRAFEQLHTVGGMLQDAKVYSAELHLTICDDLRLMRALDPITGLVPITKIQSAYDEDYASGILLNNESVIGLTADFNSIDNGDSEIPAITNIPSVLHTPSSPEVVLRKKTPTASADSSAIRTTDNSVVDFENLNTGIPSVKQRRRSAQASSIPALEKQSKPEVPAQSRVQEDLDHASLPTKRSRKPSSSINPQILDIKVGDWLIHPPLGKCFVQSVLPNNCLQIHTEVGSDHDISMSYFHAVRIDDINGVPCYRLDRR